MVETIAKIDILNIIIAIIRSILRTGRSEFKTFYILFRTSYRSPNSILYSRL